ncbi:hypothetical protein DENSPDRAFT_789824, partial [Dentipellis sp. KUC8613]
MPLEILKDLSKATFGDIAIQHNIFVTHHTKQDNLLEEIQQHIEQKKECCLNHISIFLPIIKSKSKPAKKKQVSCFPPKPLTSDLTKKIIRDYCEELKPENILESGCAVCAQLNKNREMEELN